MIELKSNYLRALLVTAAKGDNTYRLINVLNLNLDKENGCE